MRTKIVFLSLLIALAGPGSVQAYAQQDEDVRGAFLTTRPKASARTEKTGPPRTNRRRPKPSTSSDAPASATPPRRLWTSRPGGCTSSWAA